MNAPNAKKKAVRINSFKMTLPAKSVNESFARLVASSFLSQMDPTVEELCDMKTAVSEAVTNSIVHAYAAESNDIRKKIVLEGAIFSDGMCRITIRDYGCGISDVKQAMQPMYSGAGSEERSGMGFTIMQSFTDKLTVRSSPGKGTKVVLQKYIKKSNQQI